MSPVVAEPMHARPWPDDQMAQLFAGGWPPFITADQEVKRHIGFIRETFADLELALLDDDDVIVATGWAVPVSWNGDPAELPAGYTNSLGRAVAGHEQGTAVDTLVVMAAQVHPDRRGLGLAGELLTALRRLARTEDWYG